MPLIDYISDLSLKTNSTKFKIYKDIVQWIYQPTT